MTGGLTIRLLGQVRVQSESTLTGDVVPGGRRGVLVLARLVVDAGTPVRNDDLADAIWPDQRPAAWKAALRNVVAEVRSWFDRLGAGARIVSTPAGYRLDLGEEVRVDVDVLLTTPARGEALLARGLDVAALALVDDALADVRAGFLPGEEGLWVREVRRRLSTAVTTLFVVGATAALRLGEVTRAEVLASRAVEQDEVREEGHRLLMRALSAGGNRGAALLAYHRCREVLVERLGSEPSSETRALFQELLVEDDRADVGTTARPPLLMQAATPLVGRREELARVEALLDAVQRGGPLVVRVEGEAGIGKTRFAAEVAARLHRRGVPTLYGRADDRIDVPHHPLLEAVDAHLAQLGPQQRRELLGPHGRHLARSVPAVRDLVAVEPRSGVPDVDRRRLALAVGEVLAAIAGRTGAVLVLDDMHWGGRATLELLEELGGLLPEAPLLVLVLRRAGDGADPERTIVLPALDLAEVEALATSIAPDRAPDPERSRAVWAETGGNPLFATELLRAGARSGPSDGSRPAGRLRQLVLPRVATLSRGTRTWLDVAAVAGLEFEPELVRAAGGLSPEAADEALAAAEAEGLVTAAAQSRTRRAFRHALVRQCLLDDLAEDPVHLMRLHERLGSALEERHGASVPQLAYHSGAAAPLGDWRRATTYGVAAALTAARALVHDDVVAISSRTLAILAEAGDPDPEARLRLTVLLGTAQRERHDPEGEAALEAAFEEALALGAAPLAAEAALGFTSAGAAGDELAVDTRRVGLYERALAALGDGSPSLRAQLLGRLSTASGWLRDGERGRAYAEEALELARAAGDVGTVGTVLVSARRGLSGTGQPDRERAIEDELLELATRFDDPGLAAGAWLWRFESAVELGRGDELEACLEHAGRGVAELGVPSYRYTAAYAEAARLLLRGEPAAADAAVEAAYSLGTALGIDPVVTGGIRLIQLMGVRHEQGRLAELRDELGDHFGRSGVPEWEGTVAFADAELGRFDTVDGYLQKVFAGYQAGGLRTGVGIGFAAHMANPVARVGDHDRARLLYEMLLPFRGLGTYTAYFTGPVDHALAMLARTVGRADDARQHRDDAIAFCVRLGAPLWVSRCGRSD